MAKVRKVFLAAPLPKQNQPDETQPGKMPGKYA